MVTLADVAKKANVSKMTVSRVINHPEQVTDELKELVFKAMKELNYRPNVAAKALANNRTQVIKLFILEKMDTTEPYYMNLLMGMAQELDQHQYSLQLVTKNGFDIGACDGYIITGFRGKDFEWIDKLEAPIVLFGENARGYDFVDTDNQKGTELTTEYAIQAGYQNLVFVGIDVDEAFEFSREAGYINTMQKHQKIPEIVRFENRSRYAEEYIVNHWKQLEPNTAFICASDRLALGIERGLLACGGKIPEDFGISGFDGVFLDQIASPRLLTAKQPIREMGATCVRMLLRKIEQGNAKQGFRLYEPKLVIRDSMRTVENFSA